MRLDSSCATITEPMPVPIYDDLVQLARICWRQSHVTQAQDVARELRRMAREYQQQAAKLDGGRLPYFGTSDDERQT